MKRFADSGLSLTDQKSYKIVKDVSVVYPVSKSKREASEKTMMVRPEVLVSQFFDKCQ